MLNLSYFIYDVMINDDFLTEDPNQILNLLQILFILSFI
jgi:hypothetical protein